MGVAHSIHLPVERRPAWSALLSAFAQVGETPSIRMIDGLPAFPDEVPADDWKEVRLMFSGGMVTLRQDGEQLQCVAWGSDDPALQQSLARCHDVLTSFADSNEPDA